MTRPTGRPIIKLRSVENDGAARKPRRSARIIAISSGKGGVGKSSITLNLAIELVRLKQRVCIFDADTNLANINIMTGLSPQFTLQDVLAGKQQLQDILLKGPRGVCIVPAASGMLDLIELDASQRRQLLDSLRDLEHQFDYILLDTAAGISESVLGFLQAASETIITITTEPTSLTDAFSLLKVLRQRGFERPFQVVVNRVESQRQAKEVLMRFSGAVKKYLGLKIIRPGYVLDDRNVPRSVMQQMPYTMLYPQSPASRCLRNFAQRIHQRDSVDAASLSDFLQEQTGWVENIASSSAPEKPDSIKDLLQQIDSAPFDQAEQLVAQINRAWLNRIDAQQAPAKYLESDGFRAAVRFAGKLLTR